MAEHADGTRTGYNSINCTTHLQLATNLLQVCTQPLSHEEWCLWNKCVQAHTTLHGSHQFYTASYRVILAPLRALTVVLEAGNLALYPP